MARFETLDLNLLRAFDVIYAERNLTRSAKVLNVSQPAVSNALNRLRESLGDQLFVRGKRGMMPTPFAEHFAGAVHNALDLVRSGISANEDFQPETSERRFRISMNDPAETLFLFPLIEKCIRVAPGVDISSTFVGRYELANEMGVGALDAAVEVPIPADERVNHAPLVNESYACMVRPGHPLAGRDLRLEDYLALDHIHVSARRHGLGHVDRAMAEINLSRHIKVRIRSAALAADIVNCTNLSMSMPERFAKYYQLTCLKLPFPVPPIAWQLYWPSRLEQDAGSIWMREQILEIAAQHRRSLGEAAPAVEAGSQMAPQERQQDNRSWE